VTNRQPDAIRPRGAGAERLDDDWLDIAKEPQREKGDHSYGGERKVRKTESTELEPIQHGRDNTMANEPTSTANLPAWPTVEEQLAAAKVPPRQCRGPNDQMAECYIL